jgi:hypothetical protein
MGIVQPSNVHARLAICVPASGEERRALRGDGLQDGHDYYSAQGHWRANRFRQLIAWETSQPSRSSSTQVTTRPGRCRRAWNASNRSLEYDSLGDRYTKFLLEEILPEAARRSVFTIWRCELVRVERRHLRIHRRVEHPEAS